MNNLEIVIDTNVLEVAGNPNGCYKENNLNAIYLLTNVVSEPGIQICIDYEGLILKEYKNKGRMDKNKLLSGWFIQMIRKHKFTYYSSKLKNKIRKKLEELEFHKKDFKFVAVADNSCSEIIVVEIDKGWNEKVRSFLETINLLVLNCKDCLKKVSN